MNTKDRPGPKDQWGRKRGKEAKQPKNKAVPRHKNPRPTLSGSATLCCGKRVERRDASLKHRNASLFLATTW